MFTNKRQRGRPPGRTAQGEATRQRLYDTALRLFAERGYEATTLRAIAAEAGVSPGLLYRYFPSKLAVVLALYDSLSAGFATAVATQPAGRWTARFHHTLRTSLDTLKPHRAPLSALSAVMVSDGELGLFSEATSASRRRVQGAFEQAVARSRDAPEAAHALGRLLYLLHLGVILFWLLDRSPAQQATDTLITWIGRVAPAAGAALWLPGVGRGMAELDRILQHGLGGAPDGLTAS